MLQDATNCSHIFYLQINTGNILFICGGAFAGMEEIVFRRLAAIEMSKLTSDANENDTREVSSSISDITYSPMCQFGAIA